MAGARGHPGRTRVAEQAAGGVAGPARGGGRRDDRRAAARTWRQASAWGDPNAGGGMGAISVNVVSRSRCPAVSGRVNPLANDTESQVPAPPPKAKEQPGARASRSRTPSRSRARTPARAPAAASAGANKWRAQQQDRPTRCTARAGRGWSRRWSGRQGSGGVGIGTGAPFGNRFGYYAADAASRPWRGSGTRRTWTRACGPRRRSS